VSIYVSFIEWLKCSAGKHFFVYSISFAVYWVTAIALSPDDTGFITALISAGHLWKIFLVISLFSGVTFLLGKLPRKVRK